MLPHSRLFHKTNLTGARRILDELHESGMTDAGWQNNTDMDAAKTVFMKFQQKLPEKRFQ